MKNTKNRPRETVTDLPETKNDKQHLQPDEGTLDLPNVKDIPGQEHIHPLIAGEFGDTTISSDDEEGVGILDEEDQDEIAKDTSTNVSKEEKKLLRDASEKTPDMDEDNLAKAQLDNLDEDGELLNEKTDLSGSDLDIPGSEEDDINEEMGEEDEENNSYSLDAEDEDNSISKE